MQMTVGELPGALKNSGLGRIKDPRLRSLAAAPNLSIQPSGTLSMHQQL